MSELQDIIKELSPRLQQTLARLLKGDSEKQIAFRYGISPHTVHDYVKKLYKRLSVSSRGELMALFVNEDIARATEQIDA